MGKVMNILAKQSELVAELRQNANQIDRKLEEFENEYNNLSISELEFLKYLMKMTIDHADAMGVKQNKQKKSALSA